MYRYTQTSMMKNKNFAKFSSGVLRNHICEFRCSNIHLGNSVFLSSTSINSHHQSTRISNKNIKNPSSHNLTNLHFRSPRLTPARHFFVSPAGNRRPHQLQLFLHKGGGEGGAGKRHFSGGASFIARFFRLRYLLFGGAVGGGVYAKNSIDDFSERFSSAFDVAKYFPSQNEISALSNDISKRAASYSDYAKKLIDESFKAVSTSSAASWISNSDKQNSSEQSATSIISKLFQSPDSSNQQTREEREEECEAENKKVSPNFSTTTTTTTANSSSKNNNRLQTEITRLEAENKELRRNLLLAQEKLHKATGTKPRRMKRSLIDMYSEVLDHLDRYDHHQQRRAELAAAAAAANQNASSAAAQSHHQSHTQPPNSTMTAKQTDNLPRVIVIGDQSSGKTSVLEMIAQARIFPRGAGQMMTRSPVKVTLSEGPYHVARFADSQREYDLSPTSGGDLAALRDEIEARMGRATALSNGGNSTVSALPVSLSVRGPGLPRMVLVDLPGIISTVTSGMAADTREQIERMARTHMANRNAIILCVQDGSIDAERSNVTDLVSSIDPRGSRTIFVLTKVDLAAQNLANPDRIRQILSGKLFPMKALGYFGVITGKSSGNSMSRKRAESGGGGEEEDSIEAIRAYEQDCFATWPVFSEAGIIDGGGGNSPGGRGGGGGLRAEQLGTQNLSRAVSERFWRMVLSSVQQQADWFRARRLNLEADWRNSCRGVREMDRAELFEKARAETLDDLVSLSAVAASDWQIAFRHALLENVVRDEFVERILIPAHAHAHAHAQSEGGESSFKTLLDIKLREWAEKELPQRSIREAENTLYERMRSIELAKLAHTNTGGGGGGGAAGGAAGKRDPIFDALRHRVYENAIAEHSWDAKAEKRLRVIQTNALEDDDIHTKAQWDTAIKFMTEFLHQELQKNAVVLQNLLGPGFWSSWLRWRSKSDIQKRRGHVFNELNKLLEADRNHALTLSLDEVTAVRKNLQTKAINVDSEFIRETWSVVYRRHLLQTQLGVAKDCERGFFYYKQGFAAGGEEAGAASGGGGLGVAGWRSVLLFWRVLRMLDSTANALRQQVMSNEYKRIEKIIRGQLDALSDNSEELENLLTGKRVELAEDLKQVRNIQESLEEFIEALKDNSRAADN